LSGDRQWYKRKAIQGRNGGAWAGWLLTTDVAKCTAAVAKDEAERRHRRESEIAAATVKRKAAAAAARREEITDGEEQQSAAMVRGADDSAERVESMRDHPATSAPVPAMEEDAKKSDTLRSGGSDKTPDPWWRKLLRSIFG